MALDIIKLNGRKKEEFKIGYHAEPSLLQLHLHVISMDFHSPTLKTERHWNSFNTKLFIPHQGKTMPYSHKYFEFKTKSLLFFCCYKFPIELMRRIFVEGMVLMMDPRLVFTLRQTPLKCHRCHAKLDTIQDLKSHLMIHLKWH